MSKKAGPSALVLAGLAVMIRGRVMYVIDAAFFEPGATPGLSKMTVMFPGAPLA